MQRQCDKRWCCSAVYTNIWLWSKASSATNTLKPIAGNHKRNEGEDASPLSFYPLTLRASLFPGNRMEVSDFHDVPTAMFFSSAADSYWCYSLAESMRDLLCCMGRQEFFVYRVHRRKAKWTFQMWQYGTFQAQTDQKGKSTWMHMQIH